MANITKPINWKKLIIDRLRNKSYADIARDNNITWPGLSNRLQEIRDMSDEEVLKFIKKEITRKD